MATTKVNPATDPKPNVQVPITQITQKELFEYIALSNELEKLEAEYKNQTESFKQLLSHGAKVEDGVFTATVKISERVNVSWKTEAEALADKVYGIGKGADWAAKVKARTEPTPMITLDVH